MNDKASTVGDTRVLSRNDDVWYLRVTSRPSPWCFKGARSLGTLLLLLGCLPISAVTLPLRVSGGEYFDKLVAARKCNGIKVKQNGEFGKGVYAVSDFKEDELILKDQILVGAQHISNQFDCLVCSFCFQFVGSVEFQIGRKLFLQSLGVSSSNHCDEGECSSSCSQDGVSLPKEVIESLMNGELVLPYSDKFPLPSYVPCPGGCAEAFYCSEQCAEADWESSHSLLCTGESSQSLSREALTKFMQHANETNDIFLLAAKTIAFTILRYKKLKAGHVRERDKGKSIDGSDLSLLLEAWKPVSIGYKRRWWDCTSPPEHTLDCSDGAAFRMEVRELAFESLQLLKAAIFDEECEPLFSLEIYGNIIGMFELNNLDLVVASPVEDYFLYIDDLPSPEKNKAEEITQPFLDALGDDYTDCCRGTAFYPLQSCMNHSCCPNAKAFKRDEDRDGQATIIALRPISRGEEVTISYIDEDRPYEERRTLLADYGFKCKCARCLEEEP
ncbi:Histone-lysine N-methyltransferase atxr2 [Turnera subulata]|uniref:Histone-lysine N-methyltransferase atxr2 n=1 Tax=Turnera subulata TaxID=218843 RepID=A0A9Q0J7X6_9ROSI|nr:Histone-lysine N-methyltransferase atxr2 [Turnera subulata]